MLRMFWSTLVYFWENFGILCYFFLSNSILITALFLFAGNTDYIVMIYFLSNDHGDEFFSKTGKGNGVDN